MDQPNPRRSSRTTKGKKPPPPPPPQGPSRNRPILPAVGPPSNANTSPSLAPSGSDVAPSPTNPSLYALWPGLAQQPPHSQEGSNSGTSTFVSQPQQQQQQHPFNPFDTGSIGSSSPGPSQRRPNLRNASENNNTSMPSAIGSSSAEGRVKAESSSSSVYPIPSSSSSGPSAYAAAAGNSTFSNGSASPSAYSPNASFTGLGAYGGGGGAYDGHGSSSDAAYASSYGAGSHPHFDGAGPSTVGGGTTGGSGNGGGNGADTAASASADDGMPATSDFVKKLYKMLEDQSFQHVVSWGPHGDCFVVKDMNEFTKSILPRMFKHSNFASFVRQLNKYDFHKVKNTDEGAGAGSGFGEHSWTFRHPDFRADRRDALEHIKRKVPAAARKAAMQREAQQREREAQQQGQSGLGGASPTFPGAQTPPYVLESLQSLQNQVARMEREKEDMQLRMRNLERNYQDVLVELVGFQRGMAQQDGLMQNLLQYFLRDSGGNGTGAVQGARKLAQLTAGPQPSSSASDSNPFLSLYPPGGSGALSSQTGNNAAGPSSARSSPPFANRERDAAFSNTASSRDFNANNREGGSFNAGASTSSTYGSGFAAPSATASNSTNLTTGGFPSPGFMAANSALSASSSGNFPPSSSASSSFNANGFPSSTSSNFPQSGSYSSASYPTATSGAVPTPTTSSYPTPTVDDIARASLNQMNELSRRAELTGWSFDGASNSGGASGNNNSSLGGIWEAANNSGLLASCPLPDRPSRIDELKQRERRQQQQQQQQQEAQRLQRNRVIDHPRVGESMEGTPSRTSTSSPRSGEDDVMEADDEDDDDAVVMPSAGASDGNNVGGLAPVDDKFSIGIAPSTSANTSASSGALVSAGAAAHQGLQVYTVGHLMPRSSATTPSDWPNTSSSSPTMKKASSPKTASSSTGGSQKLRVRRSTFVPGWAVPPRVLLVDDDAVSRKLSSKFLQIYGCTTDVAVDGVGAVNKMNLEKYDLVLMDIVMPKLDGVSATSLIRKFDHMTPIISMTGNAKPNEIMTYYSSGMNDVLPKPFSKEGLFEMLEKHLMHLKVIQQMSRNVPRGVGIPPLSDRGFEAAIMSGVGSSSSGLTALPSSSSSSPSALTVPNLSPSVALPSSSSTSAMGLTPPASSGLTSSALSPDGFNFGLGSWEDDGRVNPLAGMGLTDEQYNMILQNIVTHESFIGGMGALQDGDMGMASVQEVPDGDGLGGAGMMMQDASNSGLGEKRGIDVDDDREPKRSRIEEVK